MDKMKKKIEIADDIVDGDIGLDPSIYLNKKQHKIRVNAFIDGDIIDELKRRANKGEGKGRYQTLMNSLLREVLFEQGPQHSDLIRRIEQEVSKTIRSELRLDLSTQTKKYNTPKEPVLAPKKVTRKTGSIQRNAAKKRA